jgi:branched-chain amino acid transport system permease protein
MNKFKEINSDYLIWVAALLVFALLPVILGPAWLNVAIEILILALAATSLNMLVGMCGVVSFGHAGFYAFGAYTYALLMYYNVAPFWVAFVAAPFATALFAVFCGYFCVKRVEVYFALLVLAFSQIVYVVTFNWYDFTKGDDGLTGIPLPSLLQSIDNLYWFILFVVTLSLLVIRIISRSTFGGALNAMRENSDRVMFIGVSPQKYLFIVFVMSAFFMGIAGALMSVFMGAAFPAFATFMKSGDFILICLMGGLQTFLGPCVGAVVYILLDKTLSVYTQYWPMVMGILIVLITLFMRGGVSGFLTRLWLFFTRGKMNYVKSR